MRSGFALLVTLAVLSVLVALSAVMIGLMDRAHGSANDIRALIQANVLYRDAANVFARSGGEEAFRSVLFAAPLPIGGDRIGFSGTVECRPRSDAININWWIFEHNATYAIFADAAKRMFRAVAERYAFEDPVFLEGLIAERIAQIENEATKTKRNGIDFSAFGSLLVEYILQTNDESVRKVPWRRLFVFEPPLGTNGKPEKIAAEYMSTEAVSLYFDVEKSLVEEGRLTGKLGDFLAAAGYADDSYAKLFTDGIPSSGVCEMRFVYRNATYAFRFHEFNGKVNRFVFLGQQQ
jgi:hypothetical protein